MTFGAKKMKPPRAWLALLWTLVVPTFSVQASEPEALTVLTWGGAYEASQRAAYFDPFTEATGIPVRTVHYDGGVAPLRLQLERNDASWDVIDMVQADALTACEEGLLLAFDPELLAPSPDGVSAEEDFLPGSITPCGVNHLVFSTVLAYNERAFSGVKPRTVEDFFDLEQFPGKRALRREPVGLLEWALLSYRVPRSQLYNLLSTERGFELAFHRLDEIRGQLVWWTVGDEPAKWLASGEVAMASGFNGRFFHAQVVEEAPISVIWDGQLVDYNSWVVFRNSNQPVEAKRFISFATQTESMAALANRISYGPTRHSAQRRVGLHVETQASMPLHMPTADAHMETAIERDHDWYARTQSLRERLFKDWLNAHFRSEPAQ